MKIEKTRTEFVYENCRLANRTDNEVNFSQPERLKNRLPDMMWKFVDCKCSEENSCTRQLCCDCQKCRNKWTKF